MSYNEIVVQYIFCSLIIIEHLNSYDELINLRATVVGSGSQLVFPLPPA